MDMNCPLVSFEWLNSAETGLSAFNHSVPYFSVSSVLIIATYLKVKEESLMAVTDPYHSFLNSF